MAVVDLEEMGGPDEQDTSLPPRDIVAEQMILGAMFKRPQAMASLTDLAASEFYSDTYGRIWQAMRDLWDRGVAIDYATVLARLTATRPGITLGELIAIDVAVPTAANVEHYARLVHDAATQRRMIAVAQKIATEAWRPGADVDELMGLATSQVAAAAPRRSRRNLLTPEAWAEAFEDDLAARQSGQRTAVMTGLHELDQQTLGLEAGALYLLMATPGLGKSELAIQIAIHVGKQHGPVLFASLEMTATELAHRFARIAHGMDRNRLAKGTLTDAEAATAIKAAQSMHDSRLFPSTPDGRYTTADLRADAIDVQAREGHLSLIVADYVQRFDDGDQDPSHREINVGMTVKALKSLAREFGCPVLAPVQANRAAAARMDKQPRLTDLRESGKLEQEADMVLGLHRPDLANADPESVRQSDRGITEIHMLKNRSGVGDGLGEVRKLRWLGTRYGDPVRDDGRSEDLAW